MFTFLAAATAALPLLASALTITSPTSAGWEGNTTVQISWTFTVDDPSFSIELGNPEIQSGLLAAGPIAVGNNIVPNTNTFSFELPVLPPGNDYYIAFVGISDVSQVYANSSSFPILDNPHSSSISLTTATNSATGSKTGATTTTASSTSAGKNSTVTHTSTTGGSVLPTSTSSGLTTEVITSLNPSATSASPSSSTTSKSGAVRGASASYGGLLGLVGFVAAVALGA